MASTRNDERASTDQQTENKSTGNQGTKEDLVQYILVRTDLNWTTGATIAQACHASVASIVRTIESSTTQDYVDDLTNMHKIILKVDNANELEKTEAKLKAANIAHHLWIERPENIPTCLAVSPQPRNLVRGFFKHLKLLI